MFRHPSRALLTALLLVPCSGSAAFASLDGVSAFALPVTDPLAPTCDALGGTPEAIAAGDPAARHETIASEFVVVRAGERSTSSVAPGPPSVLESHYVGGRRFEAVSYRPRRQGGAQWHPVTQLHAGFLDPDGPATSGFDMGFRGGHEIDDMFQIGVGLDWRTKSGSATQALQSSMGPAGENVQTQVQLSHFSSNLLPVLVYAQLSGPRRRITPYVGIAGTWEVLFLTADDYVTGSRFDATYSGFGWQAWGGLGLRLSGRAKLVAEAFMNQATLGRDLYDPYYGLVVRETIRADGIGARYGVSWGF